MSASGNQQQQGVATSSLPPGVTAQRQQINAADLHTVMDPSQTIVGSATSTSPPPPVRPSILMPSTSAPPSVPPSLLMSATSAPPPPAQPRILMSSLSTSALPPPIPPSILTTSTPSAQPHGSSSSISSSSLSTSYASSPAYVPRPSVTTSMPQPMSLTGSSLPHHPPYVASSTLGTTIHHTSMPSYSYGAYHHNPHLSSPTSVRSSGSNDFSTVTMKDIENNPELLRQVFSQSTTMQRLVQTQAMTLHQQWKAQTSPTPSTPSTPNTPPQTQQTTMPYTPFATSTRNASVSFSQCPTTPSITMLLQSSAKASSNQYNLQPSPFVDKSDWDTRVIRTFQEKVTPLHTKIKQIINSEHIENNRDFLMAYEYIARHLQTVQLTKAISSNSEPYHYVHADLLEDMIRTIFVPTDATNITAKAKTSTMLNQQPPNDIPHPYYLWEAVTSTFVINQNLLEEIKYELNDLEWNGKRNITDMRTLHAFIVQRIHLLRTPIAAQFSNSIIDNHQILHAVSKALMHPIDHNGRWSTAVFIRSQLKIKVQHCSSLWKLRLL